MRHPDQLQKRIDMALRVAESTGRFLFEKQGNITSVRHKGATDLVSEADIEAERRIRDALLQAFPNDAFVFEEEGAAGAQNSGWEWFIDPLDGTTNFIHGSPHYAVSVGLALGDQSVGGVIVAPALGEVFVGAKGQGVTLNGTPVCVSGVSQLDDALVATDFPTTDESARKNFANAWRRL